MANTAHEGGTKEFYEAVAAFGQFVLDANITVVIAIGGDIEDGRQKFIPYTTYFKNRDYVAQGDILTYELMDEKFTKWGEIQTHKVNNHTLQVWRFEDWTDMTAPPCDTFQAFWNDYHKLSDNIFIHCSAGVGRTGTLLTIQSLWNQEKFTRHDILQTITTLRTYRAHIVQTVVQATFIDRFLNGECLAGPEVKSEHTTEYDERAVVGFPQLTIRMPIQKVNQRLSDIIVNSEPEGTAAIKDEVTRHVNTIVIRKSKGAPGAMTLMQQKIEGNKWYAIKYGPIYANRHATTGQITFQTKSETDQLGLDSAIKQIDKAFRQCSIYAQEHNTVPQNITDLMTISENERKNHKWKESYAVLTHPQQKVRHAWPEATLANDTSLHTAIDLFYTYNGRGLTYEEHFMPLMTQLLTVNKFAINKGVWTYVASTKGVVSATGLYSMGLED